MNGNAKMQKRASVETSKRRNVETSDGAAGHPPPIPNPQSLPARRRCSPNRQSSISNPQSPIPNRQSPIAHPQWVAAVLMVALLAGCIPEKRIIWSPDGRRAAVATPNGLFFIDPAGRVLEPRLTGTAVKCDWLPDSRRLAVVHAIKAKGWADVGGLFDARQTEEIKTLAQSLRTRALIYEGDWDEFEVDPHEEIASALEIAAFLYLRDHLSEGLPEKLGDEWDNIQDLQPEIRHLQVFSLTDDALVPGKVLVRSLAGIDQPKVAPDGKHVALLVPQGPKDAPALRVVPIGGGELRGVAEFVALGYDWSPDARSLAYIHTTPMSGDDDHVQLGSLATLRVADKAGVLLKEFEERNDRVGLLFDHHLAARWLSDGRLLFSTVEMTLPATTHDMPRRWSLFALDPRMPASVHRVLRRDLDEPLAESIPLFDVSPDGKRVLLPGSNGRAILYEFATGNMTWLVDTEDAKGKTRSLPSWRNNAEVCFVRPITEDAPAPVRAASGEPAASAPAEGRPLRRGEIVLWKVGTDLSSARTLSTTWTEEMAEGWLSGE